MKIFNRNLFFFLAGMISAFISFLFFIQIQTKIEPESTELSVVTKKLTVIPTITPADTPVIKSGDKVYYVSPAGSDGNDGLSQEAPFKTIQKAIDLAQAGESVTLLPGIYLQDVVTKRSGILGKPIIISVTKKAIFK